MIKAGMNKKLAYNLVDGYFTPITFSEPRFETKVDILKDLAKFKTKKSDNFIYNIKESYVFPEDKLDSVYDKWEDRKFFPTTFVPSKDENGEVIRDEKGKIVGKWEGGYKPELEGAVTNDKGRVVYDERGKIKKEPTLLQT